MVAREYSYFIDLSHVEFADKDNSTWLHAMPIGKVQHPFYGEMDFSEEALAVYAANVNKRVLGTVDPVIDYDHQMFNGLAAGWVKKARVQKDGADNDGLQLQVVWTDEAKKRIAAKEYRYFSPTFTDQWQDQNGKEHKNVIFGGGLTNRPYLKNLVPVNLSELSFGQPTPTPANTEDEVDLAKLREVLGLAADVPEDQVYKTFSERLAQTPPPVPPTPPAPPVVPQAPVISLSGDLKALAETNPVVKQLVSDFEAQIRQTADTSKQLRDQNIAIKLSGLDRSNLIVTPATKDLIHDVASELSGDAETKFWQLMDHLVTSQAFVVEMGERAKTGNRYTREKSASQQFKELTDALVASGTSYPDAVERVSRENRELYDAYREESFAFKA